MGRNRRYIFVGGAGMTVHMQHPDYIARSLCGWVLKPHGVNVVPYESKSTDCLECKRLYRSGQKVVDI